jgi:hypothetical protein
MSGLVERQQGLERSSIALVTNPFAASLIDLDLGLGTGAMVVQVGVQELPIEAVDVLGVAGVDIAIAHVLANDGAIFGLDQAVIARLPGAAFGLLDEKLVEQLGDGAVDEPLPLSG